MTIRIIVQPQESSLSDPWYVCCNPKTYESSFDSVQEAYDLVDELIPLYGDRNKYLVVNSTVPYRSYQGDIRAITYKEEIVQIHRESIDNVHYKGTTYCKKYISFIKRISKAILISIAELLVVASIIGAFIGLLLLIGYLTDLYPIIAPLLLAAVIIMLNAIKHYDSLK